MIFDTEEEEIISSIDVILIQKALLNIISNSIKFTEPGGKIDVLIELEEENIKIKVTDNGIGIEKEHLENIFAKFYQISPALTRSSEGGGIGLYIVREIVELHNGKIDFVSEFNVGSTMTITLPKMHEEDTGINYVDDMLNISEIARIEMADLIHY